MERFSFENESIDIEGISIRNIFREVEKKKKSVEYLQYLRFSSYLAFSRDEAPSEEHFRTESIGTSA